MNNNMATVHIWEYDGRKFRVLLSKNPFNIIIQEALPNSFNEWVILDEKLFEELAHDGLDPLMIRAYDIVRAVHTVCEIMRTEQYDK